MAKEAASWEHINDLSPWENNPSIITDDDIEEALHSLLRFGFGTAMVGWRSKRRIVGGHARRLGVLRILQREPTFTFDGAPGPGFVPIRWVEFKSEDEAAAYALRDNNRIGSYDPMRVVDLLEDLQDNGTRVDDLGWDEAELIAMRKAADAAAEAADDDDDGGGGDSSALDDQPHVKFRKWKLLMTTDEAKRLEVVIRDHYETRGTTLGLVKRMLDGEL